MALAQIHVAAWQAAYRGVMADAFLDGLDVRQLAERWRQTLAGTRGPEHTPETVLVVELGDGPPLGFAMTGPERQPSPQSETRRGALGDQHRAQRLGSGPRTAAPPRGGAGAFGCRTR
jgi:hypothetical protein